MTVDTPRVQLQIAKWTFGATLVIGGLTYIFGARSFTCGLVFGVVVSIANFRVVSIIMDIAFRTASPDLAKVLSFAGYHVRFWILVVVMYLVIPRTPLSFGIGLFSGLLLPKVIMGAFLVMKADGNESWQQRVKVKDRNKLPEDDVHKPKHAVDKLHYPGFDENPFKDIDDRFDDPSGWF